MSNVTRCICYNCNYCWLKFSVFISLNCQLIRISLKLFLELQGGSNMPGTVYTCLHTNQSRSYFNYLVNYFLVNKSHTAKGCVLQPERCLLNTVEKVCVYKENMGESIKWHTVTHNKIFDVMLKRESQLTNAALIKTCSSYDITVVSCKQTNSKQAPDTLIAWELHKKFHFHSAYHCKYIACPINNIMHYRVSSNINVFTLLISFLLFNFLFLF